jgi:cytochrome c
MRKSTWSISSLFALLALPVMSAQAQQPRGELLAQQKMCYGCHQMDKASIGPPWVAIAARHAASKDLMIDVLASRIVRGGGGNWGVVPMVPHSRVSEAEARILAAWVLAQKPQ